MKNKVYCPNNKLLTIFKEHIINKVTLLVIAFFALTTTTFSQSATCAGSTTAVLTVNAAPITGSVSDATVNDPTATACAGGAITRDGWYQFTATSSTATVTVTSGNRQLVLYAYSGNCGTLTQISCANTTPGGGGQTEVMNLTGLTPTTIYYVRVVNSASNTMALDAVSVASPPANNLCTNATALPCGTTNLAGTTVNTANIAHGTGCSMSNYGVWYTFVGDGNPTTITTNPAFDIKLSVSTGTCASMTNIVCTDSSPEQATFTTVNGTTYYVYVADWSSSGTTTGTFTISRSCVTCAPPTATAATNVTFTTATVNWNAPTAYTPSNGYQYAVTTSATPPGSGTATTATSVNVNSLTANTVYYLHVRSDCNANGFSVHGAL